ncbi:autophagy-related protein 13 [[Candida] jaroonii]|uniref:Autophagy-related protein 13 n=1 Tax=[Candida] jaroonii TaxID=467808 RepID=A0ACA9Y0Q2_9ASCO|nr:autophagy-related protein 13 [[Candida] jaroonii]
MVSPGIKEFDKSQLDPYLKKQNAKLTQVVQNFFIKIVTIIITSRSEYQVQDESRINKWFNLLMPSINIKDDLKIWKNNELNSISPMIIETLIDLKSLDDKKSLILNDENNNPWTVFKNGAGKKNEIVVERWLIEFDHNEVSGSIMDELPLIYKQAIVLFRSLYGFTRLMPAYKIKKNTDNLKPLKLVNKVVDGKQPISSKGRIGLSKSIIPHQILTTDSHLIQRQFHPIQTTLGTLKVSVVYRRHSNFKVVDSEVLSQSNIENALEPVKVDFEIPESKQGYQETVDVAGQEEVDARESRELRESRESRELRESRESRESRDLRESRESREELRDSRERELRDESPKRTRPSIQPFKVGSIGNSPPPNQPYGGSSLERRISITSNRSTSNASLVAMLRNPRGSVSSTTGSTTTNIPISNSPNPMSVARSISSSHGSNFIGHEENLETGGTPRFSSSFGSRASRRFSNTSIRQSVLQNNNDSLLGTSAGSTSSINPLSGLYIDDDISDFVRMIDSKGDLRFSYGGGSYNSGHNDSKEILNKFQLLKSQHQSFSDSVSQSLILHQSPRSSPTPGSLNSHKSHRMESSRSNLGSTSQVNSQMNSHLSSQVASHSGSRTGSRKSSNSYDQQILPSITSRLSQSPKDVKGLSTDPSFKRPSIEYENVFDDEDGEDYYLQRKKRDDDDDLLFTMSDMNLTKH